MILADNNKTLPLLGAKCARCGTEKLLLGGLVYVVVQQAGLYCLSGGTHDGCLDNRPV